MSETMRAAVCERYGPPTVVRLREVPKPIPGEREVLVRSLVTTVSSGDARLRALRVPRGMATPARFVLGFRKLRRPILGFDVVGQVEAIGDEVTGLEQGDRVLASRGLKLGCHAEYVTVSEKGEIAKVPDGISDEDAAAVGFGGHTADHFLQEAKLRAGEKVLVNGASGAVGTMAVQLAKHGGAEVTAVCSADNAELVRGLGADHVIDYASDDFTANGQRYDVIMDTHGNAPYKRIKGSLAPNGRHLMVVGDLLQGLAATFRKATIGGTAKPTAEMYRRLLELVAAGDVKAVIDTVLPFDQIVEAHRRVDSGHKVGSVILRFGDA